MKKLNLNRSVRAFMVGLAVFMSIPAASAFGQDIQKYRDDIRQNQNRVERLKTMDTTRYSSEMTEISNWIDEARILIDKDETDKVKTLSLKIGVYVDFVEVALERDRVMGEAMEAESRLKSLKADYGKLDAMVQQLTAEEEVLQGKLESMKK
ncbi:MAG: hypothetical protein IJ268_06635 [Proteobacteria bacterium]|nr:hypothetical protein [Pseudomonadota bacterium]MBQ9242118.1 hypothetical protein [Pseudomonadota bacterium]